MAPEAPPTAGLPILLRDLRPGGDADLGSALARFLGLPNLLMTCSGTAALVIALTALRERDHPSGGTARDEVVAPAYTCPLVALAVAHCGLRLRLCDLRPDSLDFDPAALAALCGPRTLAVLPTHLGGRVVDVATARAVAHKAGAWVIEDAAQAVGARVGGTSVGAGSDMVFFSLAVGKGLTVFEGGALAVADAPLRSACEHIAQSLAPRHFAWELRRSIELIGYSALYRPNGLRIAYGAPLRRALARNDRVAATGDDFASRIPLHALGGWRQSVGVRALTRLPHWLEASHQRAQQRAARLLRRVPQLQVLRDSPAAPGAEGTWPVILVLMPNARSREAVLASLWGAGLGVSLPFAETLPDYDRYASVVPAAKADALPHARDLAARIIAIGNSPWLSDARFELLCDGLERAVG